MCLEDMCVPLAWFLFRKTKKGMAHVGGKTDLGSLKMGDNTENDESIRGQGQQCDLGQVLELS